jgi:hypothetical protein
MRQLLVHWERWQPAIVGASCLAAGLLLAARDLAGAFSRPLPPLLLWSIGGLLACGLLSFRRAILTLRTSGGPGGFAELDVPNAGVWALGYALGALLIELSLSLPSSRLIGQVGLFGCPLLAAVWLRRQLRGSAASRMPAPAPISESPGAAAANAHDLGRRLDSVDEASSDSELLGPTTDGESSDEDLTQRLERHELPDGAQWITGLVRVDFAPGQKNAHAHVAFCPPFLSLPSCDAETVTGPDAQVKVAQILPQGARFDVRLDESQPAVTRVGVEFAAHWRPRG